MSRSGVSRGSESSSLNGDEQVLAVDRLGAREGERRSRVDGELVPGLADVESDAHDDDKDDQRDDDFDAHPPSLE